MGEMMGGDELRRVVFEGSLRVGTEVRLVVVAGLAFALRSLWAEDLRESGLGLGTEPTGFRFRDSESVLVRERGPCCCCCDMYSDKKLRGMLSGERGCGTNDSREDC